MTDEQINHMMREENRRELRDDLQRLRAEQIAIVEAIRDYHYALDTRQNGVVAQADAVHAIERALRMPWAQGYEKARRDRAATLTPRRSMFINPEDHE